MNNSSITPSLTLAVCTNKPGRYLPLIERNAAVLLQGDEYICVFDTNEECSLDMISRLKSFGIRIVMNQSNLGLSYSRNRVLALCRNRYLLFLDDDATISSTAVATIRNCFHEGYGVVGIRLEAPPTLNLNRWFLSTAQYHYLGIHRPDRPASPWGACIGFDVEIARKNRLQFNNALGRKGNQLQSGDDTTFLQQLYQHGARLKVIETISVTHHVAVERIQFIYLLRRAIWQGRSEVRRNSSLRGLMKELRRNFDGSTTCLRRTILAVIFSSAVLIGVLIELVKMFTQSFLHHD